MDEFSYSSLAYAALNDFQSAKDCYVKAAALDPNNESYRANLHTAEEKLAELNTGVCITVYNRAPVKDAQFMSTNLVFPCGTVLQGNTLPHLSSGEERGLRYTMKLKNVLSIMVLFLVFLMYFPLTGFSSYHSGPVGCRPRSHARRVARNARTGWHSWFRQFRFGLVDE